MLEQRSVAVLIVAYNGAAYLDDCLSSIAEADREGLQVEVFVVDNASKDHTSAIVADKFPWCVQLRSDENRGFAGGNNWGWQEIAKRLPQGEFLYLLNQDTIVDRSFLREAVDYLEEHPNVGAVQSLLMLHPETNLVNTAGNSLHFLGFGLPTHYRKPRSSVTESGEIGYPSGAAVMIRGDWVRSYGLFSDVLFMYLEDAEIGWRLHLTGHPPHLCATSVVYHKYKFSSTLRSYFYLERNRLWLVGAFYRKRTLLLMLPAFLIMEAGQFAYATSQGLLSHKFRATIATARPTWMRSILQANASNERIRVKKDRDMLNLWTGTIDSPHLDHWAVRRIANPLFHACVTVLRLIVWW